MKGSIPGMAETQVRERTNGGKLQAPERRGGRRNTNWSAHHTHRATLGRAAIAPRGKRTSLLTLLAWFRLPVFFSRHAVAAC
jgi:hypothetical protein